MSTQKKKIYEGYSVSAYLLAKTLFWHLPDQTSWNLTFLSTSPHMHSKCAQE